MPRPGRRHLPPKRPAQRDVRRWIEFYAPSLDAAPKDEREHEQRQPEPAEMRKPAVAPLKHALHDAEHEGKDKEN